MSSPSRRHVLAAAAAALAATGPAIAAGRSEEAGEGGALIFASRAAARGVSIPASAEILFCGGYARGGDRGEALYARSAGEPGHAGKFRSTDGAWWALAENELNPFLFGAKADGIADDSAAIQAMFDYVVAMGVAFPIRFLGARYNVETGLTLPTLRAFGVIDIDGGGGVLSTGRPITIFSRIPKDQRDAMRTISGSHYDIHHLEFRGNGSPGQIGMHIGASFTNLVRNCLFTALEYGSIATFCLASAWRDNLYHDCSKRGAVLQSADGSDHGPVWPGGDAPSSPCNVSVFENCRVYGHRDQISAFAIFASDAVRMNGCISEGHGANVDVEYDFQGSPTAKHFHIDMFHCEAPAKVNFKIAASGKVTIERIVRSIPSALIDARGSTNCEIVVRGLAWLGSMPTATGKGPNPKGRWFYHSDGNGHGAAAERGRSSGTAFRFEECVEGAWRLISDPERWEGGTLPYALHVSGLGMVIDGDQGMIEWSNAPITFASPVTFADRSRFGGMRTGTVTPATRTVPAHASVSESFDVEGLTPGKHFVFVNPGSGAAVPPPGVAWNGFVEAQDRLQIRFTNASDRAVALAPGEWAYCAPRTG